VIKTNKKAMILGTILVLALFVVSGCQQTVGRELQSQQTNNDIFSILNNYFVNGAVTDQSCDQSCRGTNPNAVCIGAYMHNTAQSNTDIFAVTTCSQPEPSDVDLSCKCIIKQ